MDNIERREGTSPTITLGIVAEAFGQDSWHVLQPDERAVTKAEKVTSQGL